MTKTVPKRLKPLGNESSYTPEFLEELYEKIDLQDAAIKTTLRRTIILAAQAYIRHHGEYQRQLAAHEIKKELQKASKNIDKAARSLGKVINSGNYAEEIVDNLHDVISNKHHSLKSLLRHIKRGEDGHFFTIYSPVKSLALLAAMQDGIDLTLEKYPSRKTTPKSAALYHWIMILAAKLEPIIHHKFEQSRYHDGEYISKREIGDSELLKFIIEPLDSNVTISQIETEIKKTHKERYNSPWDDYFPE
jgi:hypothetical protein